MAGNLRASQIHVLDERREDRRTAIRLDETEQPDVIGRRKIDRQPIDRVILSIERSGKRIGAGRRADRGKTGARIPIDRTARINIIDEHEVVAQLDAAVTSRGLCAQSLQPVDVDDLVGRTGRAIAAGHAQEVAAGLREIAKPEISRVKRRQGRCVLRPVSRRQCEDIDVHPAKRGDHTTGRAGFEREAAIDRIDRAVERNGTG